MRFSRNHGGPAEARRYLRPLLAGVALLLMSAPVAFAQGGRALERQGQRGAGPDGGVTPAEIQQMFDAYFLVQAQEVLQLKDDQYPRFLTRLRALQAIRRRAENQRLQNINQLRRMLQATDGAVDESQIKERLKALNDLDASAATEVRQAQESLDEVLDLRQQARFRILELEMERRKVELLMRTRQANRPNANRPRPPQP
jgi:hypothetical protein